MHLISYNVWSQQIARDAQLWKAENTSVNWHSFKILPLTNSNNVTKLPTIGHVDYQRRPTSTIRHEVPSVH